MVNFIACCSELGRLKALHVEQTSELEAVVQRMKADKKSNEEECDQLHASLKSTLLHCYSHSFTRSPSKPI